MDVFAVDALSGRQEPLEMDADTTVSALKRQCGETFGFGEDVELSVDGQRVACGETDRVSGIAAFTEGCRVDVVRGVSEFVGKLLKGDINLQDLPGWALLRRECVLAGLSDMSDPSPSYVHPMFHSDKEVMLNLVQFEPHIIVRASAALRHDKDIALAALRHSTSVWHHLEGSGLQEDTDVALAALPHSLNHRHCLSDKVVVLEALSKHEDSLPDCFATFSDALRGDKDVLLKALDAKGSAAFQHASEALRGDREVAMCAVKSDTSAFQHATQDLRGDKGFVMELLASGKSVLEYASEGLRGDKEVALAAVKKNNRAFCHLSDTLRGDRDFVMEALETSNVLQHVSEALRGDKAVVTQALKTDKRAFEYASEQLRGDKSIAMLALKQGDTRVLESASETLRGDKDVVIKAIKLHRDAFQHMSKTLHLDRCVVLKALKWRRTKFRDLAEEMRGDKAVAMQAIEVGDRDVLPFVSTELLQDRDLLMKAFPTDRCNFLPIPTPLRGDKEVALQALEHSSMPFAALSEELRADREVVLAAFEHSRNVFHHMDEALRGDKELVMKALDAGEKDILRNVSNALQNDKDVVMKALQYDDNAFQWSGRDMRDDKEVVMMAFNYFSKDGNYGEDDVYEYVGDELRGDADVVGAALGVEREVLSMLDVSSLTPDAMRAVIDHDPTYYQSCKEMQSDAAAALVAVEYCTQNYHCIADELRTNKAIALSAVRHCPSDYRIEHGALFATFHDVLRDDLDVALAAIRTDPSNLMYAGERVRDNKEAVLAAFESPGADAHQLFPFVSAELQSDEQVCMAAVSANTDNGRHLSYEMLRAVQARRQRLSID
eukprot:TRINITY_DN27645_c0_g1_i1.p1 TRINITY_DN27645_c0_g1~~TRINITY_DN27645_c0_g1_i1.p1  ORF type:complete len:849 (+),score=176.38 TRINITY_DN27645_c0_g1_i1:48-2549(+)